MITPRVLSIVSAVAIVLAACSTARSDADQAAGDPGIWTPNPKLAPKLGLRVHFDEFSIQPPAGLELTVHHADDNAADTLTWNQPGSGDPYGGLELINENTGEKSAVDAVDDWLISAGQDEVDDMTHTDIQTGVIDGVTFARSYFKGPEHGGTRIVHGFIYIGIASGRIFILHASDLEPRNASTMPLAEAATMSLKIASTEPVQ